MVSLYLPSGSKIGSGYQAHLLANALVDREHEVDMYSPCPAPPDARYSVRQIDSGNRLRTFRFALSLRSEDFRRYDVLHTHGDDYLLFGKQRPPHVRTMHGSCFAEAIHIHGMKERTRMALLGASEILSTAAADRTVAVSQATKRWYPWISKVIPNGVDLLRFQPSSENSPQPSILFVGTNGGRKRGQLLVDAFAEHIQPRIPSVELWMVSEQGPRRPGVKVLGRVPEAELIHLYQRAWLFCLPSSYEGFGVPYIEAMACGTPVVATPNPGALEVLDSGKYGVIAEPDDLGFAMVNLLRDSDLREHLRGRGIERARRYALDLVVDQYIDLYASLANEVRICPTRWQSAHAWSPARKSDAK
jgi:phosphatidylinositol alpha-mannosyltransferase